MRESMVSCGACGGKGDVWIEKPEFSHTCEGCGGYGVVLVEDEETGETARLEKAFERHLDNSSQFYSSRFYREYVVEDHGFKKVAPLSKEMAMAMVKTSPYYQFLTEYMVGYTNCESIMNKGAIRISPCRIMRQIMLMTDSECWETNRNLCAEWPWMYMGPLWVTNFDGAYSLVQAPVEKE
jgi:hypothetical protein